MNDYCQIWCKRWSKICIVRESNPGRPRGRRAFYHWTNDAADLMCSKIPTSHFYVHLFFYVNDDFLERPKKCLHRPGIEPGPPAWQASILPLNQRCWSTLLQCSSAAVVAEWLRRLTRNQIPSGSVGSSPTDCENFWLIVKTVLAAVGFEPTPPKRLVP